MTDYAQAAAEPSWTWWMTTAAAAAAMRMQNLRDIRGGAASDDTDDEYGAPVGGKRQRIANVNDEYNNYWTGGTQNAANDSAAAGPLDLSVKATLTTTTTTTTTVINEREGTGDEKYTVTTPVKKSATDAGNGKSSKKSVASGGKTTSTAAMKAATRKLFPQLQQDSRVDRSSPVSGTIIVPAETVKQRSPSPGYSAVTSAANVDGRDSRDDDYDGDDIDPKFNVVVVTDEARRRLESIPNTLGPYLCRLCSVQYADAFALARHRCRCIVHVRYRCPECDKVFQCPANLASHRRWHGTATVKTSAAVKNNNNNSNNNNNNNNNNKIPDVTPVAVETLQQPTKTTSGSRSINNNREDDDDGSTTTSTTAASSSSGAILSAAGFKKNILHRAVQAAAAAAKYDIVDAANDTPRYAIGVHTSTCN